MDSAPTKKVLIIPSKNIDPDLLAATLTLARVVKKQGREVFVLGSKDDIPEYLSESYPAKDVAFHRELDAPGLVLKLKNKDASIKNIEWEEDSGEVKVYLNTADGNIEEKVKVQSLGEGYERIITIGIQKLNHIEEYRSNRELFKKSEIINIDLSTTNSNYGIATYVNPEASSFSEIAFNYINDLALKLDSKEATDLLSGIFWKTKSFQIGNTTTSTFQVCSDLVSANASVTGAAKTSYKTLTLMQSRLLSDVLANIQISSDKIAWSKVEKSRLNRIKPQEILFPDINLLTHLKGMKVAFITLEIEDDKTYCIVSSNKKSIHVPNIAEIFGADGQPDHAEFYSDLNIEITSAMILKEIRKMTGTSGTVESTKTKSPKEPDKKEETKAKAQDPQPTTQNSQPTNFDPLPSASEAPLEPNFDTSGDISTAPSPPLMESSKPAEIPLKEA